MESISFHQNLAELVTAWERPETIVVQEPFWTPTARRADIVFPSSTPLERNDIGGAENLLISHERAVDPPGEARDDYEIMALVAEHLDLNEQFTEGRSADEWVQVLYELFRAENDWAPGCLGPDLAALFGGAACASSVSHVGAPKAPSQRL